MSRPAAVPRSAIALAGLGIALYFVARATGSGWLVVILSAIAGVLAVGAVWPAMTLARVSVEAAAPRDATVGRPVPISLRVAGHGGPLQVRPAEPPGDWLRVERPDAGEAVAIATRRDVVSTVVVEARAGGPLGILWWSRRWRVQLARPMEVGPAPADVVFRAPEATGGAGGQKTARGRVGDEIVRSIREYLPGDPVRLVHWTATARWGELMVKELEEPETPQVAIVVDLRPEQPPPPGRRRRRQPEPNAHVERAASRAGGLANAAVRAGFPVTLLTAEAGGPRVGRVTSSVETSRRLARAVDAPPPDGPLEVGTAVVFVRVGTR